ncbi:MAG: DNA (cytosine-5-)-methyltransferase [Gammaproteobacteria bacterium]|nr:DNA (cytosine-5-)-methyltransferase [Gammaproteobacteria bacterium]
MKCLSLFANVGIGETYFKQIGIDVVVANELLVDRAEFYKEMHPDCAMVGGEEYRQFPDATTEKERNLGADITDPTIFSEIIEKSQQANVDFIMATPPCQGMSVAHAKRADKNDPRNSLIKQVVRATKELKPKYVLIENVPGMASEKTFILDDDGARINIMPYVEKVLGEEYILRHHVLDAVDYATPHHRKRLITLLSRRDCPEWYHPNKFDIAEFTVEDVIGDLPSLEPGEDSPIKWHSMKHKHLAARHVHWMRHTPTGQTAFDNEIWCPCTTEKVKVEGYDEEVEISRKIKGFRSTYKRMHWDRPAPTVTMMNGSINSQNNVHPGREREDGTFSDARVLTIKELCAIIGLPLDWVDHLEHTPQQENFLRRVLGECFPPMMAKAIVSNIPKQKEMSYGENRARNQ